MTTSMRRPDAEAGITFSELQRLRPADDDNHDYYERLASRLRFSPRNGRIWLDQRRMVLLDAFALGALRAELIESRGIEYARGLLTRMGYAGGSRDAQLARRLYPDADQYEQALFAGPYLQALEGLADSEPVHVRVDVATGEFFGEYVWRDSAEGEIHVAHYGIGAQPVCWMQIGYASGYVSAFTGRAIVFREVQCCGMGHEFCRIVGKPADRWADADQDLRHFKPQPFVNQNVTAMQPPAGPAPRPEVAPDARSSYQEMVGVSARFNAACHMLNRVAPTNATVLFLGESGVGKEMFARALHRISGRADAPFVPLNCAAIPDTLIEAELFGVEKGAYTGAVTSRPGRFELAHGGTLFLDEVAELSPGAQAKLLRALQEGEIERVGGTGIRRVNVRVVAATNVDLRERVRAGGFREDLYFRLNVFPIRIPPLRERRDDLPLLMETFVKRYTQEHGRAVTGFSERAVEALLAHGWPGNIRELENAIERGVILAPEGGAIDVSHLFMHDEELRAQAFRVQDDGSLRHPGQDASRGGAAEPEVLAKLLREGRTLDDIGDLAIDEALRTAGGNVSAAARLLGITRARLDYRLARRRRKG